MKEFFMSNWASLIVILVLAVAIAILSIRGKKDILKKIILTHVNDAEDFFGRKTGPFKFAYVLEHVYASMPPILKIFLTYNGLEELIESTLEEAKLLWKEKVITPRPPDSEHDIMK